MFELNMDRDLACRTLGRDLHAFTSRKFHFDAKLPSFFADTHRYHLSFLLIDHSLKNNLLLKAAITAVILYPGYFFRKSKLEDFFTREKNSAYTIYDVRFKEYPSSLVIFF